MAPLDDHTYGNGQVASRTSLDVLGDRAIIDTPFSTTGYTAKMIVDKQLTSIFLYPTQDRKGAL